MNLLISCQKIVTKLSTNCQKLSQNCHKDVKSSQKVGKKLAKS
jgi:hypothetical protein